MPSLIANSLILTYLYTGFDIGGIERMNGCERFVLNCVAVRCDIDRWQGVMAQGIASDGAQNEGLD